MKVFSRKINIHIFLVSILLIFVFSNILGLQNIELNFLPYPFEKSVLELIQSTILLSTIFIYIQSSKYRGLKMKLPPTNKKKLKYIINKIRYMVNPKIK